MKQVSNVNVGRDERRIYQVNLPKNFREYVKDESYPEFCADHHFAT